MNLKIAHWIATCGSIGHLKFAPGTFGSLTAIPFLLLGHSRPVLLLALTVLILIISIWSSAEVSQASRQKDPSFVVVDELCGMMVSFLFMPLSLPVLMIGFVLFRFFDIVKPPPLRWLERFPKGFGIVLDDVGAGVYTNLILQILIYYAYL
ncbi:MAG: phosphatidylglycerophosphatase A [Candidatus Omnitrophica bacterium]|nr:phosphatidylglycerophosphatase A [Candidatus Omnitrophota bacterium]